MSTHRMPFVGKVANPEDMLQFKKQAYSLSVCVCVYVCLCLCVCLCVCV